jgi:hypothetical protein
MTALTPFPPLARDRSDEQFLPEERAKSWAVKRITGGRPSLIKRDGQPVLLDLYASFEELEEAVDFRAGLYRLYQVDDDVKEVAGKVAYVEVRSQAFGVENLSQGDRAFELAERLAQANEHKDLILADITKSLIATQAELQRGAASLLNAANETIKVANGVDALEREPHVDVEELSERLTVALGLDEQSPDDTPWFVELLKGPVGVGLMQFANTFLRTVAEAQARAAQARPAQTPETTDP